MPELPQTHLADAARFWERVATPQNLSTPPTPPGQNWIGKSGETREEQSADWSDGRDEE